MHSLLYSKIKVQFSQNLSDQGRRQDVFLAGAKGGALQFRGWATKIIKLIFLFKYRTLEQAYYYYIKLIISPLLTYKNNITSEEKVQHEGQRQIKSFLSLNFNFFQVFSLLIFVFFRTRFFKLVCTKCCVTLWTHTFVVLLNDNQRCCVLCQSFVSAFVQLKYHRML